MTHNRQDLRTLVRRRLGDLASPFKFSDDQVNQWLNDAIADYSVYFPRLGTKAIVVEAGSEGIHHFALEAGTRGILSVEFPTGEEPPIFLRPRDRFRGDFYAGSGWYDFAFTNDQSAAPEIWLSAEATEGQAITVRYQASHSYLDSDDDTASVPEQHFEALVLFCRWAAYQELASTESSDPDPASDNLQRLEVNAARAEQAYRGQMAAYQRAESDNRLVRWEMDGGRVY